MGSTSQCISSKKRWICGYVCWIGCTRAQWYCIAGIFHISLVLDQFVKLVFIYRAPTALQMTFLVPSDLQPYLEVLPIHGVVQGESSFAAQLKFTPIASLLESDSLKETYYTQEDDIWRMPIQVGVANQVCETIVVYELGICL